MHEVNGKHSFLAIYNFVAIIINLRKFAFTTAGNFAEKIRSLFHHRIRTNIKYSIDCFVLD